MFLEIVHIQYMYISKKVWQRTLLHSFNYKYRKLDETNLKIEKNAH